MSENRQERDDTTLAPTRTRWRSRTTENPLVTCPRQVSKALVPEGWSWNGVEKSEEGLCPTTDIKKPRELNRIEYVWAFTATQNLFVLQAEDVDEDTDGDNNNGNPDDEEKINENI